MLTTPRRAQLALSWLAVSGLLMACGEGDDAPAPPPPPAGVTLSGTAATDAALAGAAVEAKCNGSSGSATAGADGSYTISLSTGSLPCVLVATPAGGGAAVLHSLAQASGTAHITPVSQLIVGSLAGRDPAAYYSAYGATEASALTSAALAAAQARVVNTLKAGGADFSAVGSPINAALVPTAAGNAFGQALNALVVRLAARGLTLGELSQAIVRASPHNTTAKPGTVSLPPQALLQPASPTCSALRSGTYRSITPRLMPAGSEATSTFTLNAPTGVFTHSDGGTEQFVATASPCAFTIGTGPTSVQIVVSQAGVIVARSAEENNTMRLGVAFPEQTATVAELAGDWQSLGLERNAAGTAYGPHSFTASSNASGVLTFTSLSSDLRIWAPLPATAVGGFSLRSDAGFNTNYAAGGSDRTFAYRAGNGELMLVVLTGNGSFTLWTQQRTNGLPTVGALSTSWGMWTGTNLVANGAQSTSAFTTATVDSTTGVSTRTSDTDGHLETLTANNPRNGWTFRTAATASTTAGGTVNVLEFSLLSMRGMGISPLWLPALSNGALTGAYFVTVARP